MKMGVFMPRQASVVFWFVGPQVVDNHVNLLVRIIGNHVIHKIEELSPPAAIVMACVDLSRDNVKCSKQRRDPVAFILMASPSMRGRLAA